MSALIMARNLKKTHAQRGFFGRDRGVVLPGVDFEVWPGEWVVLAGRSGCGKTTLARILAGLDAPDTGKVLVNYNVAGPLALRSEVCWIPQDPGRSLNPRFTALEAIMEPIEIKRLPHELAGQCASRAGLEASLLPRRIRELSGGQKARVAIARALTLEPSLLILDESLAALDLALQEQILDALLAQSKQSNMACLFIAHETALLENTGARIELMEKGQLVKRESSTWQEWRTAQPKWTADA
ncbi:MAG: ATP-binding cassette domain-containing protein [Bryobacteraceae bacterium]